MRCSGEVLGAHERSLPGTADSDEDKWPPPVMRWLPAARMYTETNELASEPPLGVSSDTNTHTVYTHRYAMHTHISPAHSEKHDGNLPNSGFS